MKRYLRLFAFLTLAALEAAAATLEYLSLDEMAARSTAVVRGRVSAREAVELGPVIYTRYRIEVLERWKGTGEISIAVDVPGGVLNGRRMLFSGAPRLEEGAEYVLFLWTGPGGGTQIIGLSQGLFLMERDAEGEARLVQAGSSEPMLDARTGRLVTERPLRLKLSEIRARVRASSGRAGGTKQ